MPAKVKGFLKGLKYFQQIFDGPKEPELQIGLPTDVKHVAHIGGAGPSSNTTPSWMSEFDSTQLTLPPVNPIGGSNEASCEPGLEDDKQAAAAIGNKKEVKNSPRGPLSEGNGPPLGSPPKRSAKKHRLRKNRAAADSTNQETPNTTGKHHRRHHKSSDPSSNEPSSALKPSRRKRSSKSSSGGESSKASKSKAQDSFDEVPAKDTGSSSTSKLSKVEEETEKGNG
ncbi:hypothetical protein MLD38_039549 [Melastoma candidum]|uniref:Uncharacterized protein n=1 Tax=Melastoma candidum TaxID=119954 RepID=A0ACB9L3S8_9MYRT|nr:hypothetical protein MLD38_039549 [Melastoma candidum]